MPLKKLNSRRNTEDKLMGNISNWSDSKIIYYFFITVKVTVLFMPDGKHSTIYKTAKRPLRQSNSAFQSIHQRSLL